MTGFRVLEGDRILAVSSFAFDLSVYDIFGAYQAARGNDCSSDE